jgi:hypothetical protein
MKKFKISGDDRRILKKRLSFLRSFYKNFWQEHQMEKDMNSFYGGTTMTDDRAKMIYDNTNLEILKLENLLKEEYGTFE